MDDPLVISLQDAKYELTDIGDGVQFDMNGDGTTEQVPWVSGHDDAFLVLDRNGNGYVDDSHELFSENSPQPRTPGIARNGFRALGMFDEIRNGGNGDGWIDADDRIFLSLKVWRDHDTDGSTDPGELLTLVETSVSRIALDYTDENSYRDEHGNLFLYSAPVQFSDGRTVDAWMVYFGRETCADG